MKTFMVVDQCQLVNIQLQFFHSNKCLFGRRYDHISPAYVNLLNIKLKSRLIYPQLFNMSLVSPTGESAKRHKCPSTQRN